MSSFLFHLTGRCHIGEELLEDNPILTSNFQFDESDEYDGRVFSDSESD